MSRISHIAVVIVGLGWVAWAAGTSGLFAGVEIPPADGSARVTPLGSAGAATDDVYRNARIAQERMGKIHFAYALYLNDHNLQDPPDWSDLYPDYVSDPLTFWHPGDSDPPPTTIDNSVPNAPNSAQISFELRGGYAGWRVRDLPAILDNTPDNNEGLFINFLTRDRHVETDPPLATPTPTAVALAQMHLTRISRATRVYIDDNAERLPLDLLVFWGYPFGSPRTFWNPGDSDPLPETINNSKVNGPNSTQISFRYLGSGWTEKDLEPDTIWMHDISPDNNEGFGINVIRGDFRVQFVPVSPLGDADLDCHVDLADVAALQNCFTGPDAGILDNACRVFDWDGDDDIELNDLAHFVAAMTGPDVRLPRCDP